MRNHVLIALATESMAALGTGLPAMAPCALPEAHPTPKPTPSPKAADGPAANAMLEWLGLCPLPRA